MGSHWSFPLKAERGSWHQAAGPWASTDCISSASTAAPGGSSRHFQCLAFSHEPSLKHREIKRSSAE
eukprot:6269132-Prorocentrum_lima.AAC.1